MWRTRAPRHVPLHLLPLTVGRSAPSEMILEGSTVSRRHCRFERQGDSIVLTDLGSTNGTFVNSERIDAPVVLEDGARITIGAHALSYHRRSQQELAGWEALDRELGEAHDYVLSVLPPPITDGTGAGRVVLSAMHAAGRRCVRLSDARFPVLRRLHAGRRRSWRGIRAVLGDGGECAAAAHAAGGGLPRSRRGDPRAEPHVPDGAAQQPVLHHVVRRVRHGRSRGELRDGRSSSGVSAAAGCDAGRCRWARAIRRSASRRTARSPPARAQVAPGSSLFLFSDGVFEITDREGREWGLSQILSLLPMMAAPSGPRRLYDTVRMAARPGPLEDDFSALAMRFV